MQYQTHFAAGAAAGSAVLFFTGAPVSAVAPVLAVSALAGLLPDIDHGSSLPNKLLGIGGAIVSAVVAHRSATHSLLAAAALALGMLAAGVPELYVLAALAGMLSHLITDSFNPQGVPWFWPAILKKLSLPLVITGGPGETLIARPASYAALAYFLARYFGVI